MRKDLITIPEAAEQLGIHADTLYRLARTEKFPPAIQIGSRWRVSVPMLERFVNGDLSIAEPASATVIPMLGRGHQAS